MGMQRTDGMQRMDFETLVQTRKSVRGFTKEPVSRAVIEDIIEVAKRAPSSMNTQPWHIHALTGEPLEEVRRRNMEEMIAGAKPKRDIYAVTLPGGKHSPATQAMLDVLCDAARRYDLGETRLAVAS